MPVLAQLPMTQASGGPEIQLSTGSASRLPKTTRSWAGSPRGQLWPSPRKELHPHLGFWPREDARAQARSAERPHGWRASLLERPGLLAPRPGERETEPGRSLTLPLCRFPSGPAERKPSPETPRISKMKDFQSRQTKVIVQKILVKKKIFFLPSFPKKKKLFTYFWLCWVQTSCC